MFSPEYRPQPWFGGGEYWKTLPPKGKRKKKGGSGSPAPAPTAPPPPTPVEKPDKTYGDVAKTLVPYLSPEDSRSLESYYGFVPANRETPNEITGEVRNYYLSRERAQSTLDALENMKKASGNKNLGPGYTFLTNVVGLLGQYGGQGGEGMSRQSYAQFATAVNNLIEQAKGNQSLAPYTELANLFAVPSFSAGILTGRGKSGPIISKKLFT